MLLSSAPLGMGFIFGLHGWQWISITDEPPVVLFGIVRFVQITDRPEIAKRPPDDQRVARGDNARGDIEGADS